MKTPGISIITPTLNSERTITRYFEYLNQQKYPKNKFEIILLDGGSTDRTLAIAKKFRNLKVRIITAGYKSNQEARRYIGFKNAKYDLVLILDSDNYLYSPDALHKLSKPMVENQELVGSFSIHYHYDPQMPLFSRYIALFGNLDPTAYYLHKADRQKFTEKSWSNSKQIVKSNKDYTILKFNKFDFPTLGSNGFLLRKKLIKIKEVNPESFFHTDILFDLLKNNKNKYAVMDTKIIHDSSADIIIHLKKRFSYMFLHHLKLSKIRRYKVFDVQSEYDKKNLLKFTVLSLTFVEPLIESIQGYLKIQDRAWFLHPILSFGFLIIYSTAVVKSVFNK